MDITILNIISTLLIGGGLFGGLTKYNVPELSDSFYNINPFQIKQRIIDRILTYIYTGITLAGLFIQIIIIIYGSHFEEKLHQGCLYWDIFFIGFVITIILIIVLSKLGLFFARRIWLPKIENLMKEAFNHALYTVENNGENYQTERDTRSQEEKNLDEAEERVEIIEKLLEINNPNKALLTRLISLKTYFI